MSLANYRRLESGQMQNPLLRYLVNCAIALDVDRATIIEYEWCEWFQSNGALLSPPPADYTFWNLPLGYQPDLPV
jgi:hypothetical protein